MKIIALAAVLAGLSLSPARADPPPGVAPPYRPGVSLQPVTLYDRDGNLIGAPTGSVTAPGTPGSQAQAVQGIPGGVPVGVSTQRAALFTDALNLASPANAAFVGTVRDLGTAPAYTKMVAALYTATSGTFFIQACVDSGCGNNYTVAIQAVTTTFATITAPVVTRYMRVQWINNGTAGTIGINSSFLAN